MSLNKTNIGSSRQGTNADFRPEITNRLGQYAISSNVVSVEIKGQPIGLLKSFNIDFKVSHDPIKVWGETIVHDFSLGHTYVEMSGDLYFNYKNELLRNYIIPNQAYKMAAQSLGKFVFDVVVYHKEPMYSDGSYDTSENGNLIGDISDLVRDIEGQSDGNIPKNKNSTVSRFAKALNPLIRVEKCRFNGTSIKIDTNKQIMQDFKLVGSIGEFIWQSAMGGDNFEISEERAAASIKEEEDL